MDCDHLSVARRDGRDERGAAERVHVAAELRLQTRPALQRRRQLCVNKHTEMSHRVVTELSHCQIAKLATEAISATVQEHSP